MENLSILEKQSLAILKQLEYYVDTVIQKPSKKGGITYDVTFGDIDFSPLRKPEELYSVANYLSENNLNFLITFDLVNDHPVAFLSDKAPTEEMVVLGQIKGKDTKFIKNKIDYIKRTLINKKEKTTTPNLNEAESAPNTKIIFYIKQGLLQIGKIDINIGPESLERTLLECTINSYPDEISWDEIYEKDDSVKRKKDPARSVRDAKNRINEKVRIETNTKSELVKSRRGNYRLNKKVTKR